MASHDYTDVFNQVGSWMSPLTDGKGKLSYNASGNKGKAISVNASNLNKVLNGNQLFARSDIDYFNKFFKFGHVDPYNTDQITREYLFFTKPDLYIMDGTTVSDAKLNDSLKDIPFFIDAYHRHKESLGQLQGSLKSSNGKPNPFMTILTNSVTSKMDLPGISAESQESTSNVYGVNIAYRSHSFKSDNGFDFSLSFTDTMHLDIYTMVKAYDEYMRLNKMGQIVSYGSNSVKASGRYLNYIVNKIIPEQFSVYKFLIGSDGETIRYYAKATGVYFVDVPRGDFGDPPNDGFKYSISFHANFIEDNNPIIIEEFNKITRGDNRDYIDLYDYSNAIINNAMALYPRIQICNDNRAKTGTTRTSGGVDYRLRWTSTAKSSNVYSDTGSGTVAAGADSTAVKKAKVLPATTSNKQNKTNNSTNSTGGKTTTSTTRSMRVAPDITNVTQSVLDSFANLS